jgi:LPXTG-motif cell wall-anchored protein
MVNVLLVVGIVLVVLFSGFFSFKKRMSGGKDKLKKGKGQVRTKK